MSRRVNLVPAFVLHTRPYKNSSLIVELFCQTQGRIAVVARSARGLKSRYQGKLQLFSPLLVSYSGFRDLKTLGAVELSACPILLDGEALYCGFYLNELLLRLLKPEDPYPNSFTLYQQTLLALQQSHSKQFPAILRRFEKNLLERLGYGLCLTREATNGQAIQPDDYYQFIPEKGFIRCTEQGINQQTLFHGASLLALAADQLDSPAVLQNSKRLLRLCLARHLGSRPLSSREFFV